MNWFLSHSAHSAPRALADRHYNRQKVGSQRFVPPGRCKVFYRPGAVWATSWPYKEYVLHEWGGAWINSIFRREGAKSDGPKASVLIREAVAATRYFWDAPELGMITFIDRDKVREKKDYGFCYRRAGFEEIGETKGGLLVLQLKPKDMPEAQMPHFYERWYKSNAR